MRALIVKNAADHYRRRQVISYKSPYSDSYAAQLEKVAGQWVTIETQYLFRDQFNTAPIPGVTELGLRITLHEIEYRGGEPMIDYEGDERLERICRAMQAGKIKCHHYQHASGHFVDLAMPRDQLQQLVGA